MILLVTATRILPFFILTDPLLILHFHGAHGAMVIESKRYQPFMDFTNPFIRCPDCGSVWTYESDVENLWKCGYCHSVFFIRG